MKARRITGIVIVSLSVFLFFALTGLFSRALGHALIGILGVFGYPLFVLSGLIGIMLIMGAKYRLSWKYVFYLSMIAFCVCAVIHMTFTLKSIDLGYGAYLSNVFNSVTPSGLVLAWLVWPIANFITPVGAYCLYLLVIAIFVALLIDYLHASKNFKKLSMMSTPKNYNQDYTANGYKNSSLNNLSMGGFYDLKMKEGVTRQPLPEESNITETKYKPETKENLNPTLSAREDALKKLGFGENLFDRKFEEFEKAKPEEKAQKEPEMPVRQSGEIDLSPKAPLIIPDFESAKKAALEMMHYDDEDVNAAPVNVNISSSVDHVGGDEEIENEQTQNNTFFETNFSVNNFAPNEPVGVEDEIEIQHEPEQEQNDDVEEIADFSQDLTESVKIEEASLIDEKIDEIIKEIQTENPELLAENQKVDEVPVQPEFENLVEKEINENDEIAEVSTNSIEEESEIVKNFKQNFQVKKEKPSQESFFEDEKKEEKKNRPTFTTPSNYIKPSISALKDYVQEDDFDDEELKRKANILEETLNTFKVPVNVVGITKGPAVTRFELQVQQGITVKKILQFSDDIAMALEAKGGIRIEAPIPGKNAVGIEVPNSKIQTIGLKNIINSEEFRRSSSLAVGLGRDIGGSTILCDIKEMPHLLVAGSTGSGKSVCLSVLLVSLLYKLGPDDLKLILIDPKRVEFSAFNGLPHMLLPEAITEPKDAISALNWAMAEMDRRYTLFHELKVNKIDAYNAREEVRSGKEPKLPFIVIVIDELADLIMTAKRDVEERIRRLAQLSRAAGIHLVVATQRPSVDVITGTIKANLPSRIAFMVSSGPDSKTILDQYGAENLLGKGDMLYNPSNYSEPKRVQCAFVSGDEVRAVVDEIKQNNQAIFDENVQNEIFKKDEEKPVASADDDSKAEFDSILPDALKLAIETHQASVSMIQRRFAVGYQRAARILDQMERMKFVSPFDGSKARSVYITMEEYNAIFGEKE